MKMFMFAAVALVYAAVAHAGCPGGVCHMRSRTTVVESVPSHTSSTFTSAVVENSTPCSEVVRTASPCGEVRSSSCCNNSCNNVVVKRYRHRYRCRCR